MSSDNPELSVTMQSDERRTVGVVALISMLRMIGLFSLLPVLSLYAGTLESATPLLIGLAVGGYGLTQASLQIPMGALSDRIGRRPVIAAGLVIFAIGSAVAALSDSIYGVIVGRLLQGGGAISATLTALIADATRPVVRTRSMAIYGVGFGLSFFMAVVLGPLISAHYGVPALFWLGVFLAVAGGGLLWLLPDIPRPVRRASWSLVPALRPELLRIDCYVFLLHAISTATFVALPFLLSRDLEIAATSQWKMYIGAVLASLAITIPLIIKDNHQGQGRLLSIAVILLLIGQLLLTFAGFSTATVFVALVVYFGGFSFLEAGLPARLSLKADEAVRGASLGVFSSAQFLGVFAGGLIGGRFLGHGRPADVFFVCTLLAAIWLALHGFGGRQETAE